MLVLDFGARKEKVTSKYRVMLGEFIIGIRDCQWEVFDRDVRVHDSDTIGISDDSDLSYLFVGRKLEDITKAGPREFEFHFGAGVSLKITSISDNTDPIAVFSSFDREILLISANGYFFPPHRV